MTVDTTDNTVTGTGDGVTDTLSFPYLVYQASHMSLTIDGVATSAWSAATYGDAAGITITYDTAPADGAALVAQRIVPYTQDTDLENFDGNDADVTEKQFDLLAMADQQLAEEVARSIVGPIGTALTTNVITGDIDTTVRVLTLTTAGPSTATLSSVATDLDTAFVGLATGDYMQYNSGNWRNRTAAQTLSDLGAASVTTANTWTKTQTFTKGSDVASASALTLGDGNYFDITGTTTITSITTKAVGTVIKLHFDGILTLTHHATNLILPSGANITTAAGDEAEFVEYASGDWRCTSYTRASGEAVVSSGITEGTKQASTSGTTIDFTSIPAGTKRITICFQGVSHDGTSAYLVRIGDTGGVENTGYVSTVFGGVDTNSTLVADTSTAGFMITDQAATAATDILHGAITLTRMEGSTFLWVCSGTIGYSNRACAWFTGGSKALSAELDRVQITSVSGDTFDAGAINIIYE